MPIRVCACVYRGTFPLSLGRKKFLSRGISDRGFLGWAQQGKELIDFGWLVMVGYSV